ncbi:MAG TPA: 16S rRNA (cytosine(967)-C(5))-methyltransferase RsmB [Rudaea sp.]|nr:16S rRNA (cytosine(967)-C(5))-methyltransferase RsmB [Rudaea sp.]
MSASRPDPRALAAQALAGVVAGQSLRAAFAAASTKLPDARDRALLSGLLHEGARWWLRFDAALGSLLERPLREREADVHALLVLGLVQLEIMGLSDYAAVAATVEATRALRKPAFAGLVNAVLRRWLRERATRCAELDRDAVTRTAHPRWLIEKFDADWPDQAEAILAANNAPAPLWLRVNRRRIARADFAARLAGAGIDCRVPEAVPDAIILDASRDVTALPGYVQGLFSVQDGAAQQAAALLDLRDGQRVLDACAAPGGKSAHILESADVELTARDSDASRLPRLRENLQRLGLSADVSVGDAADPAGWWDGKPFDRILLDAPCSATGIIRRQPDVKLHRRAADVPAMATTQARLLDALWPLLGRGGRLVYATCSLLADENARQIGAFLARQADARAVATPLGWRAAGAGVQNLPGESGMDGFFYALVEKHN